MNKVVERKKQYCVSLDEQEVEKAVIKIKEFGGRLSTLLNNLLKKFNRGNNV